MREVEYREGEVVRLAAVVGYHIHLELERGETFVALGAGDAAAVDIAAEGRHVMLKPKAQRVATNLTLVSSRRVYHFEYRTYEAQPPTQAAIFALRFRYPRGQGRSDTRRDPCVQLGEHAGGGGCGSGESGGAGAGGERGLLVLRLAVVAARSRRRMTACRRG